LNELELTQINSKNRINPQIASTLSHP